MSTAIPFNMKKEDLIARLESLVPLAKKQDAETIAKHKRDENEHLAKFRDACRAALKWDYEHAKSRGFEASVRKAGSHWKEPPPHCPRSRVEHLNRLIAMVKASSLRHFQINPGGKYSNIYDELVRDMPEEKSVC